MLPFIYDECIVSQSKENYVIIITVRFFVYVDYIVFCTYVIIEASSRCTTVFIYGLCHIHTVHFVK